MSKRGKLMSGLAVGLLVVAFGAGFVISAAAQPTAQAAAVVAQATAAPTAGPTATPGPKATTTPGAKPTRPTSAIFDQLRDSFVKAFAARLGVDEAKLNGAFSGAIADVVDQAVKDGKLTQAQADQIKNATKDGLKSSFPGFGHGMGGPEMGGPGIGGRGGPGQMRPEMFGGPVFDAIAKSLSLTTDELKTQQRSGKTIADIAKTKNVDVAKVKDAALAAYKTQLDEQVKSGKLTQAQADTAYQQAPTWVDQLINGPMNYKGRP